jgi:hypothetical protein
MVSFVHLLTFYLPRWKKARQEGGYRSEITYCRRNFLNRTSLLTLEVILNTAL